MRPSLLEHALVEGEAVDLAHARVERGPRCRRELLRDRARDLLLRLAAAELSTTFRRLLVIGHVDERALRRHGLLAQRRSLPSGSRAKTATDIVIAS